MMIEETTAKGYLRKEKESKTRKKANAHAAGEGKTLWVDGATNERKAKRRRKL